MSEDVIKRALKCGYYLGEGISDRHYSVSWDNVKKAHLVFYYHCVWNSYIVWNASVMLKTSRKSDTANFGFESEALKRLKSHLITSIESFDKKILYNNTYEYFEKMVVIPQDKLFEFCENYEEYIYPSEEDLKCRNYLFALPKSQKIIELTSNKDNYLEVIRERDRVSRARRDPDFRDRVLKKYNHTCIVCGCKEPTILEAAHIKGVAEGGDDSTDNGMCLCRNHHKLYDAALLDIDLKNGVFVCRSKEAMQMPWYKEAHNRNYQLVGIENGK